MLFDLNTYLGLQPKALELESRRMQVLADNLANVDTPGYKARDINFQAALAAATGGTDGPVTLAMTHSNDLGTPNSTTGSVPLEYQIPFAPSLDGNTVDSQVDKADFAASAVRYQATLTFISNSLRNLVTAITGQ